MTTVIFESPRITGNLHFEYDENGCLISYKNQATLTTEQLEYLGRNFPTTYVKIKKLTDNVAGATATIIVNEVTFEMFYEKYGNAVAKKRSLILWNKMHKQEKVKAYLHIDRYKARKRKEGTAKQYPDTYLRNEPWND